MTDETCRVPLIRREDAAPKALAIYEQSHREHGRIADLYRALANSPELLAAWTGLAWPLRSELGVP